MAGLVQNQIKSKVKTMTASTVAPGERDNFSGEISFTVPSGGYTKGLMYQLVDDGVYAVARETKAENAACLMALTGRMAVTKDTGTGSALVAGGRVFLIPSTGKITGADTDTNVLLDAVALNAAADSATTGDILIISPTSKAMLALKVPASFADLAAVRTWQLRNFPAVD
jgi:hypothetical protein